MLVGGSSAGKYMTLAQVRPRVTNQVQFYGKGSGNGKEVDKKQALDSDANQEKGGGKAILISSRSGRAGTGAVADSCA